MSSVKMGFRGPLEDVVRGNAGFGHREHLVLAWRYLQRSDRSTAERQMCQAVRELANAHGTPDKYHETLTVTWIRIVAMHLSMSSQETFEEFIERCPALLDQTLPERHFSKAILWSCEARSQWVEPDVLALPA